MKRADIILIAGALALAAALALLFAPGASKGGTAVVYVDGVEYARMPLYEADTLLIERSDGSKHNIVETDAGGNVWMMESNCKNQICVEQGRINEKSAGAAAGGWIVCLPNGVTIHIEEGGH